MNYIDNIASDIKLAAKKMSIITSKDKNDALDKICTSLDKKREFILKQNEIDIKNAYKNNMSNALIDRLSLNNDRIDDMINGIKKVMNFCDPVGSSSRMWTLPNGLKITKISVPIGVIAIIYEGRPNVTVDAFALALKSGNAIILRGSSSAIYSNMALEEAIVLGLKKSNISSNIIHLVKNSDRRIVKEILNATDVVDLAIPRGGRDLINMVVNEAKVPTLRTGEGNNHVYVDEYADINMAINIIKNAKLQRVGTCNAVEKLLVHNNIAEELLKRLYEQTKNELKFRADKRAKEFILQCEDLTDDELNNEYLDYILGIKIVDNINDAISHINTYGTMHSECIITDNLNNALYFQKMVDAACVYVNASTRFTDGSEFGFGLEMGISTQKLHARGPVGLNELITYKYLIMGNGQIR